MMNFNEYQRLAARTAVPKPDFIPPAPMYYHWLMGICGEVAEIMEAIEEDEEADKIKDEVGDLLWYIVAFAEAFGVEINDSMMIDHDFGDGSEAQRLEMVARMLPQKALKISENLKKHDWYQSADKGMYRIFIEALLGHVLSLLSLLTWCYGIKWVDILHHNIEKLKKRYPNGFDA